MALYLGVTQLCLGLPLKLGLGQFNADDGHQPLSGVIAYEIGLILLDELEISGGVVDDSGDGGAKPGKMATAVLGIDAVGKAIGGLGEALVILQGHLNPGAIDRL